MRWHLSHIIYCIYCDHYWRFLLSWWKYHKYFIQTRFELSCHPKTYLSGVGASTRLPLGFSFHTDLIDWLHLVKSIQQMLCFFVCNISWTQGKFQYFVEICRFKKEYTTGQLCLSPVKDSSLWCTHDTGDYLDNDNI